MSTVNQVTQVQLRLDESGGAVFFTLQQIYDALNEAQLMVLSSPKLLTSGTALSLTVGTDLIAIPTGIMIPQYVVIGGLKYFVTTMAKLEQYDRYWKSRPQAQPTHFVLWDIKTLRCFPKPDATYAATVWGFQYPTVEIAVATPSLTLPDLLQEVITYRALAELLEHTHSILADEYQNKSDDYLKAFMVQTRNRQGHNISRLRPGTTFQNAQSGVISIGNTANTKPYYQP